VGSEGHVALASSPDTTPQSLPVWVLLLPRSVARTTDCGQRAVDRKRFRQLRSTHTANIVGVKKKLRSADKHADIGYAARIPIPTLLPGEHSQLRGLQQTVARVRFTASAFASSVAPISPKKL